MGHARRSCSSAKRSVRGDADFMQAGRPGSARRGGDVPSRRFWIAAVSSGRRAARRSAGHSRRTSSSVSMSDSRFQHARRGGPEPPRARRWRPAPTACSRGSPRTAPAAAGRARGGSSRRPAPGPAPPRDRQREQRLAHQLARDPGHVGADDGRPARAAAERGGERVRPCARRGRRPAGAAASRRAASAPAPARASAGVKKKSRSYSPPRGRRPADLLLGERRGRAAPRARRPSAARQPRLDRARARLLDEDDQSVRGHAGKCSLADVAALAPGTARPGPGRAGTPARAPPSRAARARRRARPDTRGRRAGPSP